MTTVAPPPPVTTADAPLPVDDHGACRRRPTTEPATTTVGAPGHPVGAAPPSRLRLRVTVLVTPLLLGALAVPSGGLFRGAKFRDLHVYRQYGDALLAGHLPYRDFFVEYPPGAIPLFAAPSLAPDGAYDAIFKVLMTLCCVACDLLRRASCSSGRGASRRAIWTAALFLALVADRARAGLAEHLRRLAGAPDRRRASRRWSPAGPTLALGAARCRRGGEALRSCCSCRSRSSGCGASAAARSPQALGVFAVAAAVLVVPWFALSPGGVWDSVALAGRPRRCTPRAWARACCSSPTGSACTTRTSSSTAPAIVARPRRRAAAVRSRRRRAVARRPRGARAWRVVLPAGGRRSARVSRSRRASPASSPSRRCSRRSTSSG